MMNVAGLCIICVCLALKTVDYTRLLACLSLLQDDREYMVPLCPSGNPGGGQLLPELEHCDPLMYTSVE